MTEQAAPLDAPPSVLVLANPRLSWRIPGFAELVAGHLGPTARVETVEGLQAMTARAREAVGKGVTRLAAAGGDGTVGLLLRALLGMKVEFGILPIGTFNNFAHSLGIPNDLAEACRLLLHGKARSIDLGRVTSRRPPASFVFKEIVGVGVDATAFAAGADVAGPSKIVSGSMSVARAVIFFRPHPVKFCCDGERGWIHCTQLLVANTAYYAAGFPVLPEAMTNDGRFNLLARTWRGRLDLLRELPAILSGRHCSLEHDVTRDCTTVRVTGHARVLLHADGEFFCRMPATIEILPGAVRVVSPPAANSKRRASELPPGGGATSRPPRSSAT